MMRHILLTLFLFSAILSFGQIEQKKEKERRVAPAMNNVLREEVTVDEVETISKSGSSSSKIQQIQSISASISATLSQASRMKTQRSFTDGQKQMLLNKVAELKAIDKNSFEYHLYDYLKEPYDFKNINSLKRAESINAYDYTVLRSFAAYHRIQSNDSELKQYLSKLNQGKYFRSELDKYAGLTLKSLPKGAVLITHGNEDTYPLLIQQYIKNVRSDVEIISLDHLISEVYREKLKNKSYKIPNQQRVDTQFLADFVKMNEGKKIVCSSSLPKPYLSKLNGELMIIGYGYSTEKIKHDNRSFYENEIKDQLPGMISQNQRTLLSNSLPLLFDVRNKYIEEGKIEKQREIEKYIRLIGKQLGRNEQINALLN